MDSESCMLRSMNSKLLPNVKLFSIVTGWLIVAAASTVEAQPQTYAQTDIAYGAKIYGEQCTVCHGATGDVVAGVDLRANRFKRASSDFDLYTVITTGVP